MVKNMETYCFSVDYCKMFLKLSSSQPLLSSWSLVLETGNNITVLLVIVFIRHCTLWGKQRWSNISVFVFNPFGLLIPSGWRLDTLAWFRSPFWMIWSHSLCLHASYTALPTTPSVLRCPPDPSCLETPHLWTLSVGVTSSVPLPCSFRQTDCCLFWSFTFPSPFFWSHLLSFGKISCNSPCGADDRSGSWS